MDNSRRELKEAQEISDVWALLAITRRGLDTGRMAFTGGGKLFWAVVMFYGGKDLQQGNPVTDLTSFWGTLAGVLYVTAGAFLVTSAASTCSAYWSMPLLSKLWMLSVVAAIWMYSDGRILNMSELAARLLRGVFFAGLFELVTLSWVTRSRSAEWIRRLRRLGQVTGVLLAAGLVLWLAVGGPSAGRG